MMDMNEFGKFGEKKRHNSLDGIKRKRFVNTIDRRQNICIQSQYVTETEEELLSDESEKHGFYHS